MPNSAFSAAAPAGDFVVAMMTLQLKNLDALASAQRAFFDGLGKLAAQQQDMLTASLRQAAASPAALLDPDPRAVIAKPFDAMKSALLDGTAQANLLSQVSAMSNAGVADILQQRALAALDEMKGALIAAMPRAPRV